ncbi:MAG: choice-of-anchor tandem repeat GloVer-containing protein [Terriglobales bacterium]|jgi:uncharacterized repeat protein (TIGR03803 family)
MLRKQLSINRDTRAIALLTLLVLAAVAARPAQAQTYTVLHDFTAAPDGADPNPIIRDAHGNLYGATKYGGFVTCGLGSCGTVFKIDRNGNYSVLYRFEGGDNGTNPVAGLVRDAAGNLYGSTQGNGYIDGAAVVFKLEPNGQETTLDIAGPNACCFDSPLALDAQGNLYGMSPYGGTPNCGLVRNQLGCGTLFKLTPSSGFTVLHTFTGTDGIQPEGGVVLDGKGNLYGTASTGGELSCDYPGSGQPFEKGCGTIYKLDSSGKFTLLHTFTGPGDGADPLGVIIGSDGNLYGIAGSGGDIVGDYLYGLGTIFKVDTSGNFSVLFTFVPCNEPPCTEGQVRNPVYASQLLRDSKGNLYGLQQSNNCAKGGGCLFRIDTAGNITDLYDFEGEGESTDGFTPMNVVFGSAEDVYGSMFTGGASNGGGDCTNGCGTVFHLTAH